MQNNIVKPLSAGVVAYAVQKYYLNKDNTQAMYFGGSVAAGMYASEMISPMLKKSAGSTAGSLMEKVLEIGAGVGSAVALNTYVLKNTSYRDNMMNDVGVIVLSSVASEFIDDFVYKRKLDYWTD